MIAFEVAVENGETGLMETIDPEMAKQSGYVLLAHYHADGSPMFPGDPDRHDAGAGDRVDVAVRFTPPICQNSLMDRLS